MTFKKFMTKVGYLPANMLSGLSRFMFGSTAKNKYGEKETTRGVLGFILDGIKYVAESISNLIINHKKAVAVAAWLSLAVATTVGLLLLWPVVFTAVTTFSIYGVSIASIVGANAALQIVFTAGLAALATSIATYFTAAVANTISAIINFIRPQENGKANASASHSDETPPKSGSEKPLSKLSQEPPCHGTCDPDHSKTHKIHTSPEHKPADQPVIDLDQPHNEHEKEPEEADSSLRNTI